MMPESEKYNRVVNQLRKSRPHLTSTKEIEDEVIKRISINSNQKPHFSDIVDFVFGWVYIGWVRRSLITASVLLVLIFIWQQSIIINRINFLSSQTITTEGVTQSTPEDDIEKLLTTYKFSGRRFNSKTITISEKEMEKLLERVNELQVKYKDLENLIESDPELKSAIEKKLIESSSSKIKL